MEISLEKYEETVGYKYVSKGDILEMIEQSGNYRFQWRYNNLYPTHGKVATYRYVNYYSKDENAVLFQNGVRTFAKIKGRYYKLVDQEMTRTQLDQINSFIDKMGGFHLKPKQWKELPKMKAISFMANGKDIEVKEIEELNAAAEKREVEVEDDELPFF